MDIFSISIAALLLICVIFTIVYMDSGYKKEAIRIALWTLVAGIMIGIEIQEVRHSKIHTAYYVEKRDTIKVGDEIYVYRYYEKNNG